MKRKDMIVLVPSIDLNPEQYYFYQGKDTNSYVELKNDTSLPLSERCDALDAETVAKRIKEFKPKSKVAEELYKVLAKDYGLSKLLAVEVNHCPQSYACLIESEQHGKLVYSGDTLPCQNLINYASNCRVLIHEATFEEGLE